ncbi:TcfC E-set like domain-containing protein [Vibrio atypicus]|uniref:TcfC E-set like domain-containing protein n=1 Tax=Vibrio atypicus TaxID=558271 RepID=UPI00135A7A9D|nr:TcfC E-set like domain-containing protein [Vibrio atypicus]
MNRFNLLASSLLLWLPLLAIASVPAGFEDFFKQQQQNISLQLAGERNQLQLEAMVTFDGVLVELPSSRKQVRHFLTKHHLTSELIDLVEQDLMLGIMTDPQCNMDKRRCVIPTEKGKAKYVFDYDSLTLRLFVAPSDVLQVSTRQTQYHSSYNEHFGVINRMTLNGYSDLDEYENLTMDNVTLVGLPYGSLQFDTQYQTQSQQLKTFTAKYELAFKGYEFQLGQHRYNLTLNSTDFLYSNADYSGVSFSVGTSHKLALGGAQQNRQVSFYAPQTGLLQLYRNERLFMSYPVESGLQQIRYSDLPSGAYTLTMVLLVSGKEVFNEQRTVVNHADYRLAPNQIDFRFDSGWLEHEWLESDVERYEPLSYAKIAISSLVKEPILVAASTTLSPYGQLYQLGGKVIWRHQLYFDYNYAISDSGIRFQQANLGYRSLFLNALEYNGNDISPETHDLTHYLYGEDAYQEVSGGWSGNLLFGQAFTRLYARQYQASIQERDLTRQRGLSLGWSKNYKQHSFDINTNFEFRDEVLDTSIRFTWRIQLSEQLSSFVQLYGSEGIDDSKVGMNYVRAGEQWNSSHDLVWNQHWKEQSDSQWDSSHAINVAHSKFYANGYAFVSSSGQHNLSSSLSSTLLLNRNGVSLTGESSEAFLRLNTQNATEANVFLQDDNQRNSHHKIAGKQNSLALKTYQKLSMKIDENRHDVLINSPLKSEFVHKGMIWDVDFEAIPLVSELIIVEQSHPDNPIHCSVKHCRLEPLSSDGVFRLNYPQNAKGSLSLLSHEQPCRLLAPVKTNSAPIYVCP